MCHKYSNLNPSELNLCSNKKPFVQGEKGILLPVTNHRLTSISKKGCLPFFKTPLIVFGYLGINDQTLEGLRYRQIYTCYSMREVVI